MKTVSILSAIGGAAFVAAHGNVQDLVVDGQDYTAYQPYQDPYMSPAPERITWSIPGNGPIQDVTTSAIACNSDSTAGKASASAAAGSEVEFEWTAWPASHKGPVMTYMAACPGTDCTSVSDPTTLDFFKINEGGYSDGTWASETLIANNNSWTVTIPSDLKAGAYLMRHEILALHSAGESGGAQFYPMCTNLVVTGSGTSTPSSDYLVKFPGAYSATDAGILINIYYPAVTNYTVPGPAVWGNSTSGSAASSSAAASSTVAATSSVATSTLAATSTFATGTGFAGTGTASAGFPASTVDVAPLAATPATTGTDGIVTSTANIVVTQTSVQTVVMTLTQSAVETTTVTVHPEGSALPACTAAGRFRRDLF